MRTKNPAVYILTNKPNGTLYTGVTSDLLRRVFEHKNGLGSKFSAKYQCTRLVWYSFFETMPDAIHMEKFLKRRTRLHKIQLIEDMNSSWTDLYSHIYHL